MTPSEQGSDQRAQVWADRLGPGFSVAPLRRLLALDPEEQTGLVLRLLGVFEDSLRAQSEALEQGMVSADFDRIRRAAHTVRSSSLSMGAEAFAAACLDLERSAQALAADTAAPPGSAAAEPEAVLHQARDVLAQARALVAQVGRARSASSACGHPMDHP